MMLTIKLVALYGIEAFVVTVVGVTVLAGLYQLIRDWAGSVLSTSRARPAPATTLGLRAK